MAKGNETQVSNTAGSAGPAPVPSGEQEPLLPTESYRLGRQPTAGRQLRRQSRLWLLPAVFFLTIWMFLLYFPFHIFQDYWGPKPRIISVDLDYFETLNFREEGGSNVIGILQVVEARKGQESRLEMTILSKNLVADGGETIRLESLANEIVLKYGPSSDESPIEVRGKLYLHTRQLRELTLSTASLDIELNIEGTRLRKVDLGSITGSLSSPNAIRAREFRAKLMGGDITGSFGLYDSLHLSTEAGEVRAQIVPSDGGPNPVVDIGTANGDIDLNFSSARSDRKYDISVHSDSGDITGKYLLSNKLNLKSSSGNINTIVEVADRSEPRFETESATGNTKVTILGQPANKIRSYHLSKSGNMKLRYPRRWEGEIHARVEAGKNGGDIAIRGEDIELIDMSKTPREKLLWGMKGDQSRSKLILGSVNGHIDLALV